MADSDPRNAPNAEAAAPEGAQQFGYDVAAQARKNRKSLETKLIPILLQPQVDEKRFAVYLSRQRNGSNSGDDLQDENV